MEGTQLKKYKSVLINEWPKLQQYMRVYEPTLIELREVTYLNDDENLLLFYYFKFNKSQLNSDYFNNTDKYQKEAGIITNGTEKLIDTQTYECPWCLTPITTKEGSHFGCGHLACDDCYVDYLLKCFQNKIPFPKCLMESCTLKMKQKIFENLVQKLYPNESDIKSTDLYQKYLISLGKNVVQFQKKDQCCSNSDCNYVYKPQKYIHPELVYDLTCPNNHQFCYNCGFEPHRPLPCQYVNKWQDKAGDGSMLNAFMKDNPNFFRCPKCERVINYISGCDQMTCGGKSEHNDLVKGQGCGHVFCWRCFQPWSDHKGGWSGCNKFKPKSKCQKDQDNEKYMHYLQGYEDNRSMKMQKAQELLNKMYDDKIENSYNQQFEKISISASQYESVKDAIIFLIKARRTLKWTYVFGYYIINDQQRDLFEHQQGIFEEALANLQLYFTQDLEDLFKDKEKQEHQKSAKFFQELKPKITNQQKVAEQFRENLLQHLETLQIGENEYKEYREILKSDKITIDQIKSEIDDTRGENNEYDYDENDDDLYNDDDDDFDYDE